MKKFKYLFRIYLYLLALPAALSFFSGCTTVPSYDDALRIKPDAEEKYIKYAYQINMNGKDTTIITDRNGRALRGKVIKMREVQIPTGCYPCGGPISWTKDTVVYFKDARAQDDRAIEKIPIEDIDLIGPKLNISDRMFENFNNVLFPKGYREVPFDSVRIDTCRYVDTCGNCPCNHISISCPDLCPKRLYSWFFWELKLGSATYFDKPGRDLEKSRQNYMFDLAAGFRFGDRRQWGLGLALSSNVYAYNSYDGKDELRPIIMIHGRYHSEIEKILCICMKPFYYAQIGMAFDNLTLDLAGIHDNDDFKNTVKPSKPYIGWFIPISYGIGAGLDITLTQRLDLSLDLGFRSVSIGEFDPNSVETPNLPKNRRVNMVLLRLGLTY